MDEDVRGNQFAIIAVSFKNIRDGVSGIVIFDSDR